MGLLEMCATSWLLLLNPFLSFFSSFISLSLFSLVSPNDLCFGHMCPSAKCVTWNQKQTLTSTLSLSAITSTERNIKGSPVYLLSLSLFLSPSQFRVSILSSSHLKTCFIFFFRQVDWLSASSFIGYKISSSVKSSLSLSLSLSVSFLWYLPSFVKVTLVFCWIFVVTTHVNWVNFVLHRAVQKWKYQHQMYDESKTVTNSFKCCVLVYILYEILSLFLLLCPEWPWTWQSKRERVKRLWKRNPKELVKGKWGYLTCGSSGLSIVSSRMPGEIKREREQKKPHWVN